MKTEHGTLEVLFSRDTANQFYKRWITDELALIFDLDKESSSYRVFRYDRKRNALEYETKLDQYRPLARQMPVGFVNPDGSIEHSHIEFLQPAVRISPNRTHMCWIDGKGGWVAASADLAKVVRYPRKDTPDRGGQAIWFSDGHRWAEPLLSRSRQSFSEILIYGFDEGELDTRKVRRLPAGVCRGTTRDGESVFVTSLHRRPVDACESAVALISRVDMECEPLTVSHKNIETPLGWKCSTIWITVAANTRRLAWLLTRWYESTRLQAVWVTDLEGNELCPLLQIEANALSELGVELDRCGVQCKDLEWMPDETAISFISGSKILKLNVDLAN